MAVSVKIEDITPAKAEQMLSLNTRNRPKKERNIQQMERDMRAGKWVMNGESFKLCHSSGTQVDDILGDGQNRAEAVLRSGVTIKSVVVRGLNWEEVIATIDAGGKRTTGDIFKILRNAHDYNSLAAITSWAFRQTHRKGKDRGFTGSHAELLDYLDDNPDLYEACSLASSAKKTFAPLKTAPFGAGLFFALGVNRELAIEFAQAVGSGESLKRDQPAWILREWLTRAATGTRKPVVDAYPAVINTAIIAHLEGRPIRSLSYRPTALFPYVQDAEVIEA